MQEKKNQQRMEGLIKQNDFKRSIEFINTNKLLNQREEDVRKSTVAQYKELLDKQVAYNQKAKMYGNMSQVEKKLNHIELSAFKNYDNLNYALIPGINSNKEWSNPYQNRSKNKTEVNTRLNKSGMSRDIQAIIFNKPIKLDSSIIDIKKSKDHENLITESSKRHVSLSRQEKDISPEKPEQEVKHNYNKSVNPSPRGTNKNSSFTIDARDKNIPAGLHSRRLANYLKDTEMIRYNDPLSKGKFRYSINSPSGDVSPLRDAAVKSIFK